MLIDTHCHLHLLDGPADAAVAQARAEGVEHLVDVGVDLPSSAAAAANAGRLAGVSATAGVHPNEASSLTPEALDELRKLLELPEVVGVGETGLDYYRERAPRKVQWEALAKHVELAKAYDKALVLHCRDAFDDLFALLEQEGPPERVVLHCFTGGPEVAARAAAAGYYVSFSGTVTFKNAPEQREACAQVPLDRLVLETDSPFLSPHPYRGQPNRPGRVAVTAGVVAAVRDLPVAELARRTGENARRLFRIPPAGQAVGQPGRTA